MNTYMLEIVQDFDATSPREDSEWKVSSMSLFHGRYTFPNEGAYCSDDFESWADMAIQIVKDGGVCVTPVYAYIHSGIALSTKPFSCAWDSGQLGFAWTTLERLDYLGVQLQDAPKAIEMDVREYSDYVNGECYGYVITDGEGMEVESCYGFIGIDYVTEYAETIVRDMEGQA